MASYVTPTSLLALGAALPCLSIVCLASILHPEEEENSAHDR